MGPSRAETAVVAALRRALGGVPIGADVAPSITAEPVCDLRFAGRFPQVEVGRK